MSNFLNSFNISASALTAQRFRMDIIIQNMANKDVSASSPETAYRRKQVVFEEQPLSFDEVLTNTQYGGVKAISVVESDADFKTVYDPTHVDADENGYVYYSNVDSTEEQIDLMAASRSYEANITALNVVKAMAMRALQIGE